MTLRDKFGLLNPVNLAVNETLYECLGALPLSVAERIATQMRHYWTKQSQQAEHLYYEAMFGAHLARHGFTVDYERAWHGKTPDWSLINPDGSLMGIVEVSNHHLDQRQSDAIAEAMSRGEVGLAYPDNVWRLYKRFEAKADAYATLVHQDKLPYVIAVLGNFFAAVDRDEFVKSLTGDPEKGVPSLYAARPEIAGAYLFQESGVRRAYNFIYLENPNAAYPIKLQSEVWEYGQAESLPGPSKP